ncbi:MAG: aspartate 1-decarboxylase [Hydrogenobaculum sp.]|nr:MAG: aspartate 1-decarboxylase [Hydrogenobaculum sp.]PMP92531.1 MAG: aspartate 1-decarboxylase [Hydrogenobaculum sp.]
MKRHILRAKIHRATVTGANLNYEGSISIDERLLEAGKFVIFEKVDIYNVSNGNRFSTYVIPGKTGEISLNGAAARLCMPGDVIIIASYAEVEEEELPYFKPYLVYVDDKNNILEVKRDMYHVFTY